MKFIQYLNKSDKDAVALKAKVAKGTIFYHFKSKDVLFAQIVEEGKEKLEKKIVDKTINLKSNTDKIEKIIEIEVDFIKKYHDLFLVYLNDVVKKSVSLETVRNILNEGKINGEFRKDLNVEMASISMFWSVAMVCLNSKIVDLKAMKKMVLGSIKN
jgi:AcrR family transcriptional regulator